MPDGHDHGPRSRSDQSPTSGSIPSAPSSRWTTIRDGLIAAKPDCAEAVQRQCPLPSSIELRSPQLAELASQLKRLLAKTFVAYSRFSPLLRRSAYQLNGRLVVESPS